MYSLKFTESAKSDLRRLDPTIRKRILKRLAWLEENVDYMRHQQLSGPLSHLFKSVIGDHRVLYDLDKLPTDNLGSRHSPSPRDLSLKTPK